MSYAAEPYAQFVDDLLAALTGGVTREAFRFLAEAAPYRLAAAGAVRPGSVRVFGLADGAYVRFRPETDFALGPQTDIAWRARADGTPAADAVWPDPGSTFFVNYEAPVAGGPAPLLSDRNPGSVTRLLAESFAREFAVLSRQLEAVYQAGFIDTAAGRDLDQLVRLVGIGRRDARTASGSVVFSRASPAPADIFIPAGTRLASAEPPAAGFETTEDATLKRGLLSVETPIRALSAGAEGVAAAGAIRAVNNPILGIDSAVNPQATRLAGGAEDDEALRARARRALETAGGATLGALTGALTGLGLREKDIRFEEDPIAHPGVVKLAVALPPLPEAEAGALAARALALIEATRPVGVRILPDIASPAPLEPATPGSGLVPDEGEAPLGVAPDSGLFMPVVVEVELAPGSLALSAAEREALAQRGRAEVEAFVADAGIGETLVLNRLIARLMALEGVLDVAVELYPQARPEAPHRKNLAPDNPGVRPVLARAEVAIGGALVLLDVSVRLVRKGAGLLSDPETLRGEVEAQLREGLERLEAARLTPEALKALVKADTFELAELHYRAEYPEGGLRIHQQDIALPLSGLERLWIRKVTLADGGGT